MDTNWNRQIETITNNEKDREIEREERKEEEKGGGGGAEAERQRRQKETHRANWGLRRGMARRARSELSVNTELLLCWDPEPAAMLLPMLLARDKVLLDGA